MRTNSDLRAAGRASLSGRWTEAAMLTFVYLLITGLFSATFVGAANLWKQGSGSVFSLLLLPLVWGYAMTFLANYRHEDDDPFDIGHLFDGYHGGQFLRIFTTFLLMYVYVMLWSLLFIIPGIIKGLSYAMTPFILRDRPDLKNNAAIELSMDMMQGHKADLFWLCLSFIGWIILSCLTLGIGFFWLQPYMSASMAAFYESLKADFEGQYGGAEYVTTDTTDNYQK